MIAEEFILIIELIFDTRQLIIFATVIGTLFVALATLIIYVGKTQIKRIDQMFQPEARPQAEATTTSLAVRDDKQQEEIKEIRDRLSRAEAKLDILMELTIYTESARKPLLQLYRSSAIRRP